MSLAITGRSEPKAPIEARPGIVSPGEEIVHAYVPPEVYRISGFPGADDLANTFQFYRDFSWNFCKLRDPKLSRSLNPGLQTFDTWLAANSGRIPMG
jgi:hypothetical protein